MSRGLLVVGENRVLRECLETRFEGEGWLVVTAGLETVARRPVPDVVLAEASSVRGSLLGWLSELQQKVENPRFVVYGVPEARDRALRVVDLCGEGAYLSLEDSWSLLLEAVDRVFRGESFLSQRMASVLFAGAESLSRELKRQAAAEVFERLSSRELEILRLVDDGLSNRQIARRLHLSIHTVKNHVHRILLKLDVQDRRSAARFVRSKLQHEPSAQGRPLNPF